MLKKQVEQLNKQVETLTKERDSLTAEVQKLKTPKAERNQVTMFQQTIPTHAYLVPCFMHSLS